ncbi:ubiquitin-protein transferase [Aureococcus anophagefferens]|nr:ubiquitin-protein transferase [Aureococcus anophagefferens]
MSSFQGYAGTPGSEQAPNKSPSHVPDDFSTPNATVSTPIHQPPLSPTATLGNASEAPTPVRTPGAGAGAPADEEEESLRSRSRCRRRRSGTWRRSEGAQRLARLEAQRAAERTTPADPNLGTPGGESAGDEDAEDEDDDDDDDDGASEDEDDEEIDESLALAWRLQQEDDDRALLMALNGGRSRQRAPPLNVSPQMTYDQLMELGDNIGKVSKGAASSAVDALPTCKYCDAADHGAIVGDQCAICRMEFEPDDVMRVLPAATRSTPSASTSGF